LAHFFCDAPHGPHGPWAKEARHFDGGSVQGGRRRDTEMGDRETRRPGEGPLKRLNRFGSVFWMLRVRQRLTRGWLAADKTGGASPSSIAPWRFGCACDSRHRRCAQGAGTD
jgi:hypothetical protein